MIEWVKRLFRRRKRLSVYEASTDELVSELMNRSDGMLLISIKWDRTMTTWNNVIAISGLEKSYIYGVNRLHQVICGRIAYDKDKNTSCEMIIHETETK